MSASDAAPLPRLGEVFFDVRGESRSMRLSWYADTGVAVFSIWQGGMCTGTFRLPIDDLPRMVEILQRGPQGRRPSQATDYGSDWHAEPSGHSDLQDYPTGSYWETGQPDAGVQPYPPAPGPGGGADGYGQERFVPPYMDAPGGSYLNDNPEAVPDPLTRFGGPAYPGDQQHGPSRSREYLEPPWPADSYSDRPPYRQAADTHPAPRHSAPRHGDLYADPSSRPGPAEADIEMAPNRRHPRDY